MNSKLFWRIVAGLAVVMPVAAFAVPITYHANLTPLNDSGVNGTATLVLREDDNALDVTINASGLEPNQLHPQHIHGRFNGAGEPRNSVSPGPAEDTDYDGVVELIEARSSYGPILVPLTSGGSFPTAASDGTISFNETYNLLATGIYSGGYGEDDLLPLILREIVLHGAFAFPGSDANGNGQLDRGEQADDSGTLTYIAALPVASGVIVQAVPAPASVYLLLFGLGIMALGLRRRQASRV